MHAVLSTLNARYVHAATAPFCLLSGLRTYLSPDVSAEVIEGTVNEPTEAVAERILASSPTLVALSVYIWNRQKTTALILRLRALSPSLYILAGGPEAEHDAARFLAECPADAVLSGEGERAIAEVFFALSKGQDPATVAGMTVRTEGGIRSVPPLAPVPIPPSAVIPEYLAAVRGRIAYLETSRGCPFFCAFCLSGRKTHRLRYYPIDRAKRELLLLAGAGARTVKLVDRTFNADAARARELWQFLIDEYGKGVPCGLSFHFEVAGDLLTDADISLLAKAPVGLIRLEIGIQSFRDDTLIAISRRPSAARVADAVSRLTSLGNIEVHIDLIAGLPHEDLSSFAAGFDRAIALHPAMLQLGFLKLLHGTALAEDSRIRRSTAPPYEVIATDTMDEAALSLLHATADATDRLYNSARFSETLTYLFSECGLSPFSLLSAFGQKTCGAGMPLSKYTDAFLTYAAALPGVDGARLRDLALCDRLASCHDHTLPKSLYIRDERLSKVKKTVQSRMAAAGDTAPFDVGILYSMGSVVIAHYRDRHPFTHKYPLTLCPITSFDL